MDYKTAGVDIEAADRAKQHIAELARRTHSKQVLHGPGLFGGFFELPLARYKNPVLVSSVDGIGTKIKLACQMREYRGLGHDIVNHCLNDIMMGGAEPLFFLDYLAFGRLEARVLEELMEGMAAACREAECALIGGETAEMPDMYKEGEFDLAGTIVGVVEKEAIIDGAAIASGDVLFGIASNGLHTNGYSLARRIIAHGKELTADSFRTELGGTVAQTLLQPHRSYQKVIRSLRAIQGVHGFSHITGGGIVGNTRRLLTQEMVLEIDWHAWQWPPIFSLLQQHGNVSDDEMRTVFNLGIGLVVIAAKDAVDAVKSTLEELNERYWEIGRVQESR